MKKTILLLAIGYSAAQAQTNPAITAWLQNTTTKGSYYTSGNSTAVSNNILVNCQSVKYSTSWVYVATNGIPSYPTGPFLDGNPSQASSQAAIFKFPLSPQKNTGTLSSTTGGNIGVFINGVALFDYRDGVSWKSSTNALAGGPTGGSGDGIWNRDAVVAEKAGFDCAKGHPAMGNYHHHQNPSAFKLDLKVLSNICNLYDADGLYTINTTKHSPLIGFAYDGFPIYGAYAYKNTDGSGGFTRMKSGYQLRNITTRTTYYNGTSVTAGPAVSTTYPLGYFKEDYEYVSHPADPDYLDEHNGRFCITPEYPAGTYAYFCTVDSNHNSAYPYAVGPTFYGVKSASKVSSISECVTTYVQTLPLHFVAFSGYHTLTGNCLSWTTTQEKNTQSFSIEKSADGMQFNTIGTLNAANQSGTQHYSFTDHQATGNKQYYRLKQIDADGMFTYSKVVVIDNNSDNAKQHFSVYPNPTSDFIAVQANQILQNNVQISLRNATGQLMEQKLLPQGSSIAYFDTQRLYAGTYTLTFSNEQMSYSTKVLVTK